MKVETVGDAYTCASGVPIRNINHAAEIANMALAIRVALAGFKVCRNSRNGLNNCVCMYCSQVVVVFPLSMLSVIYLSWGDAEFAGVENAGVEITAP